MFEQTPLMQHLIIDDEIFVNAMDSLDPEMVRIKRVIIRESEQQPTWGESLPKCFIPLELEFASLIKHNIHVITIEHLRKINCLQPIRPLSETELKVFLTFQHSIGKVLYFGETKMDKHVILSPTYLIDAFNSIITDRRLDKGDTEREEMWDAMGKSGVLSKKVIQTIWSRKKYWKFCKDKDYLLDVMTHLDILVVPKRYDTDHNRMPTDFYYVPSMLRASDDTGYLKSPSFTQRSIAIAFQSTSFMIPPALFFRFISYCISVWAVKTYGEANRDMLFHRSGVFTIDPSLDMYILCEDDKITARLVHARRNELIPRDMASSINECLTSALEKISQMYVRTSSNWTQTSDTSFITRICCSSPDNPCVLPVNGLVNTDELWICPTHGIQHSMHTIESWFPRKDEGTCEPGCPVTNEDFLTLTPSDLHLRRLSLLFSNTDVRRIALHLGLSSKELIESILETDPRKWNFEALRNCRDSLLMTFKRIKQAVEAIDQGNIHMLCKIFKGNAIEFEINSDKWDMVPRDEHIDRLAPLVGNNSLQFLIELGMEFQTWEQITQRQNERDLVRLNTAILEEWRFKFCRMHSLKPTLRTIVQALSNVGKSVEIVVQTLSDLF
ncbi:Hypothetical predicted protein [Mytilus galloprovincialis]|uniref:COR domain-containing protein n=1 Tax=Mytilus galloprovincialis TaxID=29158 RepID=A0A8B6BH95_MYTGA|nr:Hypothetical predicted protein [Mytilus galloprovincialis]